ncbi:MAG: type II secretion system F family protein [Chloroflexota bacterium]|nr:type II secretion system F family protein [Chloroflexota bacterium]
MDMMYVGAAVLAGLAIFLSILGLNSLITASSEVDDRLDAYATMNTMFNASLDDQARLGERVNSYLNERGFTGSIAAALARADVKLTVLEYMLIKLALLLTPLILLWLFTGQLIGGLFLGAVFFFVPDLWLRQREAKRSADFAQQLPDTLALIVSGLRAGFSLQQSLLNVAKEAPEPTATEFKRLGQEVQLGVALHEALDGLVRRIKSPDLDMIVSVFKIHSRVGGNLSQVLETVSTTIRERVRLRREVQVITAQQRYASYVLGAMPPILGLILLSINPQYMLEMFQWNVFLCIPIGATVMTVLGFLAIRKIVDIKI